MEKIIILDFGSQYTQLIARKVRELKVYCEIQPYSLPAEEIERLAPKGLILSGGPASVNAKDKPYPDKRIFQLGIPILGICYGMQIIANTFGGKVSPAEKREYGRTQLKIIKKNILFANLPPSITVWMSHGDSVTTLPKGFVNLAKSARVGCAAFANETKKIYGVQFHPEVAHTPNGKTILNNFLFKIAGCLPTWTMASFIQEKTQVIRNTVGSEKVICALSGGVDSAVLCTLLHRAIGNQLIAIFVNNGLLRKNEPETIVHRFKNLFNLRYVDAKKQFLLKLKGVVDPERKRRIIGNEFIRIFEEEAKKIGKIKFLAQGTLYPDVIESKSPWGGPSATIKTHHNVGGLPKRMRFQLIEPLRELFKDEVRILGKELGLPEDILLRQPFPGPGLAVRIIGDVTKERLRILKAADAILSTEIKKANWENKLWQAFAILLPVKTVGVMGDQRTYEAVIAIRAVYSSDAMTADWADLPHKLLGRISNRIINEVKGVNRVVYDISSKPPSTIEWE
uniref:GMP synthase [glutamine-hydrolyzing] n=1 Tax=candidate division WOR-3 bacterium TaxID=2052148 RepID=A0A7C6E9V5_UNCW3